VRSDSWIRVELHDSGGLVIEMRSRVQAFYGAANERLIRTVMNGLGIEHAHIEVEDQGALPWVLAARLEAAVLRAGAEPRGDARPALTRRPTAPSARNRLRRSRLYLPGSEPKFMLNAGLHKPDAVILDLEDSVHPAEKDTARLIVRNALRVIDFGGAERMVRINQLPLGLQDLDAVVPEAPDVVLLPKAETPDQVRSVAERIGQLCRECGAESPVWIMPILESALGIENAFAIASADDSVVALTIGIEDYTADLGVVKTRAGTESQWARSRLVNAARAADVQAIDSVYGDVDDESGLRAWAVASRAQGFVGMGCIHPRQIRVIHEAYAPTSDEIAKALRIVEAFRAAGACGLGVVSLGSKMIDPPVVLRALQIVEQATASGLLNEEGTA
jgi:citrate lyase subunit beta/citryl-CoA lyase